MESLKGYKVHIEALYESKQFKIIKIQVHELELHRQQLLIK